MVTIGFGAGGCLRDTPSPASTLIAGRAMSSAGPPVAVNGLTRDLAISHDGTTVVYMAGNPPALFVYVLDAASPKPIMGSGVRTPRHPVFSPDGRWIAFFDGSFINKIAVTGGPAVTVAPIVGGARGLSWGANDTIFFATADPATGLLRVSAGGGKPEVLTTPDRGAGEVDHVWPEVLPGGNALLFTIQTSKGNDWAKVALLDLRTGTRRVLLEGGANAQYVTPGYLIFGVAGTLRAVPFDLTRLEVTGTPVPVASGLVATSSGAVDASVSADGTLVSVTAGSSTAERTLVWVDRDGREAPLGAPARTYVYPRVSPDGTQVAVFAADQNEDVWLWNLRGRTLTRSTVDAARDTYPVWTPDGRRLVFSSLRDGPNNLYWQAADGTGASERLTTSTNVQSSTSMTPDGARIVLTEVRQETSSSDLMLLTIAGERRATPLIATKSTERNGEVSPDGRWLAYESDESGQVEIYVRPFPNVEAGKWQVSAGGGTRPLWAHSGRELFYRAADGAVMGGDVAVQGAHLVIGTLARLVEPGYYVGGGQLGRTYDVAADGSRFLMIKEGNGSGGAAAQLPSIVVIQHFDEELRRVVGR